MYREIAGDLRRSLELDRSHRSHISLLSPVMCEPGGRLSESGLLDEPEHVIGKSGQFGGRKIGRGDVAQVVVGQEVADMLFPVLGIRCLEQLHDMGRAGALPRRECGCAHPCTAPGSPLEA